MAKTNNHTTPKPSAKPFMAVGPTLHYSHSNVLSCWALALAAFAVTCLFWSRISTGEFWSFSYDNAASLQHWNLSRFVTAGVSIFEYPAQIQVLGLLMGIIAVAPVLISQLMSFRYSIFFILTVVFVANLPGFALCLLISCIAAACRPLRFRSRFTAIALCTAPQLLYWGYFGGTRAADPIRWGFSFTPWLSAWIVALAIAGIVLGIGHYTRYRPGLVWACTTIVLAVATIVFGAMIGFDELDYQLYIAKQNPEHVTEFHGHGITEALDETITDPAFRKYLAGFFYPAEPIALREELKKEIQVQLMLDRWPSWFAAPPHLKYQAKRQALFDLYELFITRRPMSRRMPIALYFKALLSEYRPDINHLARTEILRFHSDYPHRENLSIWYRLYDGFPESPESIEARYRIAMHLAGQGAFDKANELLRQAGDMIRKAANPTNADQSKKDTLFSLFNPPPDSVMTPRKLEQAERMIRHLSALISEENRTNDPVSNKRLARFVMLNPHDPDYTAALSDLLDQMAATDLLRDNILLAQAKLIADEQLRAERLTQINEKFRNTDGGMQALYELALLKMRLYWPEQDSTDADQKKKLLTDARATLETFIKLYPESIYTTQAKKDLDSLPQN